MSVIAAKLKKSAKERPLLPLKHANPLLKTAVLEKDAIVKYQTIEREGQEIVVGRIKVPTPGGHHAFILRRFDTGAVSLTTMFRAAYPTADDEDEKADTAWIKASYDISGANGSYKGSGRQYLRLAGTWLPPDVAMAVADSYSLSKLILPLALAEPDVEQQYKKTTKSNGSEAGSELTAPTSPALAARAISPPNAKRRKASPAAVPPLPLSPPSQAAAGRKLRSSKSPAPPAPKSPARKPTSRRGAAAVAPTPPADDPEDDSVEIGHVDADADIEESKKLVDDVKKSYSSRKPKSSSSATTRTALKRVAEEEVLTFEPKEPEIGERTFIQAPRRLQNLPPQRQAAAWGALVFALGLGATAFLPQFL